MVSMTFTNDAEDTVSGQVRLRRIPYPYRAMLAICSDLDETPDAGVYAETMRFLNTSATTTMGPGLELEVGNSMYFDMPPEQFAYWNTDDAGREMIRTLIHSGHIDCLHSYGDLATRRADAGRTLEELARHDCRLEVWIDHGTAPTNFGADIMQGHGDQVGHEAYHADLTIGHGVRYVWRGRVTSVIGQDVPTRMRGVWVAEHPVASARTVGKEISKRMLGRLGSAKYAMHGPNRVLQRVELRDGRSAYEFLRSNPHWGGVSSCETARGIGQVLTEGMLTELIGREAVCLLYTHLGKIHNRESPLPPIAVAAFRRLARAYRDGEILVTTTRRILRYLALRDVVKWSACRQGSRLAIDLRIAPINPLDEVPVSAADLAGLAFYCPADADCVVTLNESEIAAVQMNPPDHTGWASVSLPWPRLEFPRV